MCFRGSRQSLLILKRQEELAKDSQLSVCAPRALSPSMAIHFSPQTWDLMFYGTFIMQQNDLYAYILEFSCFKDDTVAERKAMYLGWKRRQENSKNPNMILIIMWL